MTAAARGQTAKDERFRENGGEHDGSTRMAGTPATGRTGQVWRWHLGALAQLPAARAGLRDRLGDVGPPHDDSDRAGEQLILAFDELASNALGHGESPVVATVVAGSGGG